MKLRASALLGSILLLCSGAPVRAAGTPKPVMVYYMPWYASKAFSGSWGWHWTMNHFDPEKLNILGERQIASWYYPLIGPYDSLDPAVLEYHVLLMKLAGIEGVVVDWYGNDEYLDYGANNERTAALFKFTRKAGLKFCVSYEDQTIQHMIEGGYLAASNVVPHAQHVMLHLQTNYFSDPTFLTYQGRPVLVNFGPQFFKTGAEWQSIFSALPASQRPAFFTEDKYLPGGAGAFSWPPMWMSHTPAAGGVLSEAALQNYLSDFDKKAAAWPAFISSAFPRFHDIYQEAQVRDYWGYLGDRNGNTLRETLARAMTNSSAMALVVTWNDFGEGTMVEPTREYGYRDLEIIQDFRRRFLDPNFSYHSDDLAMAARLFHLRQSTNQLLPSAELDLIFSNIVSGDVSTAAFQLKRAEATLAQGETTR